MAQSKALLPQSFILSPRSCEGFLGVLGVFSHPHINIQVGELSHVHEYVCGQCFEMDLQACVFTTALSHHLRYFVACMNRLEL